MSYDHGNVMADVDWDDMGTKMAHDIPAELGHDAVAAAKHVGADYKVMKGPAEYWNGSQHVAISGRHIQYRQDTGRALAYVSGNKYHSVQPIEYAHAALNAFAQNDLKLDRGWVLGGGRVVMFGAKLPADFNIAIGDDVTEQYLYVGGGYTAKLASFGFIVGERLFCLNQLATRLTESSAKGRLITQLHSRPFDGCAMALALQAYELEVRAQRQVFGRMAERYVTADFLESYFRKVMKIPDGPLAARTENKLAALYEAFRVGPGATSSAARGTLYGALQAVTYYLDHQASTRDTDGDGVEKSRQMAVTFGAGALTKQRALRLAMDAAGIGREVVVA